MAQVAKLVVSIEGQADQSIPLADLLTIGRSTTNQLVLPDANASRRHCEIRANGPGRFRLFDLGSANGTWVNGRRLTAPKDLDDGDQVVIGNIVMRFVAPEAAKAEEEEGEESLGGGMFATAVAMRNETVVVLVCDVRGFTRMNEELPAREFAQIISDWFKQATEVIESNGGTIDKYIGDAVMCYWTCPRDSSANECNASLKAAVELMELADDFSIRVSTQFPKYDFKIGVGINVGEAIFGNVGTAGNASFTIVGDCVNVAFRLESLCREKKAPVIVSRGVADQAQPQFMFADLGEAEVKGRREPVPIRALRLEARTKIF